MGTTPEKTVYTYSLMVELEIGDTPVYLYIFSNVGVSNGDCDRENYLYLLSNVRVRNRGCSREDCHLAGFHLLI